MDKHRTGATGYRLGKYDRGQHILSFIKENARWLGAGFVLTFGSAFGQTVFIGAFNDDIKANFGFSDGDWGLFYGLCTIVSAAILTEFGKVVDRWSVRNSAIIVVVGLAMSCVAMGLASQFWVLILALVGLRLFGQGMMGHVAMVATGRWFAANRGRAVSLVSLGFPISQAVVPAIALLCLPLIGYSLSWFMAAIMVLLVILPLVWWLLAEDRQPRSTLGDAEHEEVAWRRQDVLKLPIFYVLVAFSLHAPFTMTAFFFHQQNLMRSENWPPETFAMALPFFALAGAGMALIWGRVIDHWDARSLLPLMFLPMILGCFLVPLFDGVWVVFAVISLFGLTLGMSQTIRGSLWPELFGLKYLGEIRSTIAPLGVLASAVSPYVTGVGLDYGLSMPTQLGIMGLSASVFSGFILLSKNKIANIKADEPTCP